MALPGRRDAGSSRVPARAVESRRIDQHQYRGGIEPPNRARLPSVPRGGSGVRLRGKVPPRTRGEVEVPQGGTCRRDPRRGGPRLPGTPCAHREPRESVKPGASRQPPVASRAATPPRSRRRQGRAGRKTAGIVLRLVGLRRSCDRIHSDAIRFIHPWGSPRLTRLPAIPTMLEEVVPGTGKGPGRREVLEKIREGPWGFVGRAREPGLGHRRKVGSRR